MSGLFPSCIDTNFYSCLNLFRYIMGVYFGVCMVFSVYAKVHIFIARKSAANLDLNRCNDTSVPYRQQRYNPNIIRGIIHDFNLIFLMVLFLFCFASLIQMSENATKMDFNGFLIITAIFLQLINFIYFTLIPFVYILINRHVQAHLWASIKNICRQNGFLKCRE